MYLPTDTPNPFSSHPDLLDAIARNQALPVNSFCNRPESVVRLDTGDARPVYRGQYPAPFTLHNAVDKQIAQWKSTGKVVPAPTGCQWNNPITCATKKDYTTGQKTGVRVCINPTGINPILKSVERFPLPLVKEIFAFLAGKSVFSGIDLEQSFLQLYVHAPDQQKLAFTWKGKHLMFVDAFWAGTNDIGTATHHARLICRFDLRQAVRGRPSYRL